MCATHHTHTHTHTQFLYSCISKDRYWSSTLGLSQLDCSTSEVYYTGFRGLFSWICLCVLCLKLSSHIHTHTHTHTYLGLGCMRKCTLRVSCVSVPSASSRCLRFWYMCSVRNGVNGDIIRTMQNSTLNRVCSAPWQSCTPPSPCHEKKATCRISSSLNFHIIFVLTISWNHE